MGELEEKGHNGDSAETALLVHKQDTKKVSRLYLSLFGVSLSLSPLASFVECVGFFSRLWTT